MNPRKGEKEKGKVEKGKWLALSEMQGRTTKRKESVSTIQGGMAIANTQRLASSSMKAPREGAKGLSERMDLL